MSMRTVYDYRATRLLTYSLYWLVATVIVVPVVIWIAAQTPRQLAGWSLALAFTFLVFGPLAVNSLLWLATYLNERIILTDSEIVYQDRWGRERVRCSVDQIQSVRRDSDHVGPNHEVRVNVETAAGQIPFLMTGGMVDLYSRLQELRPNEVAGSYPERKSYRFQIGTMMAVFLLIGGLLVLAGVLGYRRGEIAATGWSVFGILLIILPPFARRSVVYGREFVEKTNYRGEVKTFLKLDQLCDMSITRVGSGTTRGRNAASITITDTLGQKLTFDDNYHGWAELTDRLEAQVKQNSGTIRYPST